MPSPERLIDCPERDRLRTLCTESMGTYANAVLQWREVSPGQDTRESHEAYLARHAAHEQFDNAVHALNNHEYLHHC